jgi:proteasome assembly chaperone (PAC2) family protein
MPMEIQYTSEPEVSEPILIAAWPGMGYLAKISADFLRRRLKAELFAEISYYQNTIIYRDSLAELPVLKHRFYSVPGKDILICVGDAQPSTPEEAMKLAETVVEFATKYNVKRIYTMAAYPSDYSDEPRVYGVYTDEGLKEELERNGVSFLEGEGAVNGLNGILIGVAKQRGIDGVCLMSDIRYANVPQHLSSKAVLEKLTAILGLEIDTTQLVKRAKKIDASIQRNLLDLEEMGDTLKKEEKVLRYIS